MTSPFTMPERSCIVLRSKYFYTLRCWKLRILRVKKWSVSFADGRRSSHRFPTFAIRKSLLQTSGAQLRKINRMLSIDTVALLPARIRAEGQFFEAIRCELTR